MAIDWDEKPELNITPLVDIMLVLLAILMVTTPTLVFEENITLPDGSKSVQMSKIPTLEIRIDKNKNVYIGKDKFELKSFPDNMILLSNKYSKETTIYIKADRTLLYNDVMYVMKAVKSAGFLKVALETNG
ncbi:MAG: biopolymer transporter ExbD [Campylobacteraceae bacterium]|jgi:biopolymer transport protein ExbD|nr:biopolymer transporter ExbD [Campylobacteraceae bacterium]